MLIIKENKEFMQFGSTDMFPYHECVYITEPNF